MRMILRRGYIPAMFTFDGERIGNNAIHCVGDLAYSVLC